MDILSVFIAIYVHLDIVLSASKIFIFSRNTNEFQFVAFFFFKWGAHQITWFYLHQAVSWIFEVGMQIIERQFFLMMNCNLRLF